MKNYIANIDYEYQLFFLDKKKLTHLRQQFEFVFFFMNQDKEATLFPYHRYSDTYLKKIETWGYLSPQFSKKEAHPWWGELQNLPLERKLNSKLTSFNFSQGKEWAPSQSFLLEDFKQLENLNLNLPWVIKDPHELAGRGHFFYPFNSQYQHEKHLIKRLVETPLIVEPWLERIIDIGTFYDNGKIIRHINLVGDRGQFQGIRFFEQTDDFWNYLGVKWQKEFYQKEKDIISWVLSEKSGSVLRNSFGWDSFLYRQEKSVGYYPLVELNYRYTMGAFAHSLRAFLPKGGVGELRFTPKFININSYSWSPQDKEGVLLLSPPEHQRQCLLMTAQSLEKLTKFHKGLQF